MPGITLVGLGAGPRAPMTQEARRHLSIASEIFLRTDANLTDIPLNAASVHSLKAVLAAGSSASPVLDSIVTRVLEAGRRPAGVTYATFGNPCVLDAACSEIILQARPSGIPVQVITGPSLIEPALAALEDVAPSSLAICDALALGALHVPPSPPDVPLLVLHANSSVVTAWVKTGLSATYPDDHRVLLIHLAGAPGAAVEEVTLSELGTGHQLDGLTVLYVPALDAGTSIESLHHVVARLRAPDGCPWDREQTHLSLRRHLLEEAYEAVSAMDRGDSAAMAEEFGDLLLQIILNAVIGRELGEFRLTDVSSGIHDKIIRRHPHVFGDVTVDGVDTVLANWERLKETERGDRTDKGGLLDGVPLALPALGQAQEYQERAARVGFDWPEIQGVLDKVAEEVAEVRDAGDADALASEVGDLLFALVNLSRWKGIDAESALRAANQRFRRRFAYIESQAALQSRRLSDLSLEEMETFWQQAKGLGL